MNLLNTLMLVEHYPCFEVLYIYRMYVRTWVTSKKPSSCQNFSEKTFKK